MCCTQFHFFRNACSSGKFLSQNRSGKVDDLGVEVELLATFEYKCTARLYLYAKYACQSVIRMFR